MSAKDKEKQLEEIHKGSWVSDFLRTKFNEDGDPILEHFVRLPSRRTDAEYYKVVTEPIDFSRILQKLKTEEYMTFEQYCDDLDKMVANAKLYYKEDNPEHKDILLVEAAFEEARKKVESGEPLKPIVWDEDGPSMSDDSDDSSSNPIDESLPSQIDTWDAQDVIAGILEYTDEHGRLLCPPFRVLQSREEFPLYYEKVEKPIDLKRIAKRARKNKYRRMAHLVGDLTLLFQNAQKFSGEGTDIYEDAEELMEYVKEKSEKVLDKGCHASRKNKIKRIIDQLLVQKAEEWATSEFSEDSEEDDDTEQDKDPRWQLYWKVRNEPNEKDPTTNLADPFLELPSKTCYPDYFDEVETPISLYMVNKKLKRGDYPNVEPVFKDLMLMYENACEYNMPNSDIYTAAKKLEYITAQQMKVLAPNFDMSIYEKRLKPPTPPKPKVAPRTVPKVKIEMDTDSDSRTPPPIVFGRKKSPKKASALRFNMKAIMTTPTATVFHQDEDSTDTLRGKLLYLFNVIYSCKIKKADMYWPAGAFVDLPSMRDYPDYYEVITNPIDMKSIRDRIENDRYKNTNELVKDFKQLFSNAREYNEPDSQIYEDADNLQALLEKSHEEIKKGIFKQLDMSEIPKLKFGSKRTPIERKKPGRKPGSTNGVKTPSALKYFDEDDEEEDFPIYNGKNSVFATHPSIKRKSQARHIDDVIAGLPEEAQNMWKLFQTIKDHRDEKGRLVSVAFLRLPPKEEMPAYYEVIKKPMDLQRVHQKLQAQTYHTLSDMVADLALMLSNACKYNESDSVIYKDAVSLQRVLLEMKQELSEDDMTPHVQYEIRTIFTTIFAAVFSKRDENDRCMSDSFVELPELLKAKGIPKEDWPFSFDQIKRNIDKNRYRRLDRLQKDFFDLFEKAREVTRVGSRLFNDAVQLQKAFCEERNARCKSSIQSNAYIINTKNVDEAVKEEQAERAHEEKAKEVEEKDDLEQQQLNDKQDGETELATIEYQSVLYTAPCYAYISRTDEKKLPNHIMRIQRIFKNENGDNAVSGLWVYRPNETMHLASRKFYTNEVFVTPFSDTVLVERLRGTCLVVSVATWRNNEIEGFPEKDIYVCESKYFGKHKYFVKIKNWPYASEDEKLDMTERDRPATPEKKVSEFLKDNDEEDDEDCGKSASSTSDDDDERAKFAVVLDIPREEVLVKTEDDDDDEGHVYYQQLRCANGRLFTIGQFVLVFNPHKPLCDVKRIHKLWRDKDGVEWFSGGWFARPIDTVHDKGMMFWQKELLAVNQPDKTHKVAEIQSKCYVMQPKDYVRHRPTEIAECDVYVCESTIHGAPHAPGGRSSIFPKPTPNLVQEDYGEHSDEAYMNMDYAKSFRKMRTYTLDRSIPDEEFFIFKQPINMDKEMSPLLKCEGAVPLDNLDELMEDDTDGESVVSKTEPTPSQTPAPEGPLTPHHQNQQGGSGLPLGTVNTNNTVQLLSRPMSKSKSGYILFSAEIRKRIMHENPDAGFGEVSKIVGIEWKKLSEEQKKQYDVRAEIVAAERAKIDAAKLAQERVLSPGQQRIYQCRWANCDSQFDQENGLFEHIVQHHTSHIIVDSDQQYVCMWTSCLKNRKDGKPFPSLPRLHRHMKEKHLINSMRPVYANQIGKNYYKLIAGTGPNGEQTNQLVNMPYGRAPGAPAPTMNGHQQQQYQHVQQVQVQQGNGHINGQFQNGPDQQPQQYVVRQVAQNQGQVIYTQQQPSSSNAQFQQQQPQVHQQQQQQQQQPQQIQDPGRAIVRAQNAEPVFVAPPNSVHSRRVLHSEAYLKFIESMSSSRERSVGKWERNQGIRQRHQVNTARLPLHWIKELRNGRPAAREEDVAAALIKLKEQLLETTCNVSMEPLHLL